MNARSSSVSAALAEHARVHTPSGARWHARARATAGARARDWRALALAALFIAATAAIVLIALRLVPAAIGSGLRGAWFGGALVVHVNFAIGAWLSALLVSIWRSRVGGTRAGGRAAFTCAAVGLAATLLGVLFDPQPSILSNYVPITASPWVQAGLAGYWIGVVVAVLDSLRAPVGRPANGDGLPRFDAAAAAIPVLVAVGLLVDGIVRLVPGATFDAVAERLFWGPGHALQFAWAWLAAVAWIRLAGGSFDRRWHRIGLAATVAPALLCIGIELAWPPGSPPSRAAFTLLMACAAWPGPAWIAAGLWRDRAADRGRSTARARWAAVLSISLFATGMLVGTWIDGQTMMIPAHYHATVGAATAGWLALLTIGRSPAGAATGRPHALALVYGAGAVLLVAGFVLFGIRGAPRKVETAMTVGADPVLQVAGILTATGAIATLGAVIVVAGVLARRAVCARGTRG